MTQLDRRLVTSDSPTLGRAGAGGRPCQGVWHRPSGAAPRVAVIAGHYDVDFSEHYLAEPLARRGIGFLGWNTRYRGMGAHFILEHALVDIGVGVRWLRHEAGVDRVVLLGNSGGASLMAAYQARALGPDPDAAPGSVAPPGSHLAEALDELVPGELFVSVNAHRGRPDVLTSWLDPSVTDERDPLSVDPDLDMFHPDRAVPYAPGFEARYRRAQVERNNRITAWAEAELERLRAGGAHDRMFTVHRAWADLRFRDLTLDPSERAAGCYAGDPRRANYGPFNLAAACTLRSWLSMWSLARSACRAEPHLRRIVQPALVVQSDADQGCFPSDARAIHGALGSTDKALVGITGDHYLTDPPAAREEAADLLAAWIRDRS